MRWKSEIEQIFRGLKLRLFTPVEAQTEGRTLGILYFDDAGELRELLLDRLTIRSEADLRHAIDNALQTSRLS